MYPTTKDIYAMIDNMANANAPEWMIQSLADLLAHRFTINYRQIWANNAMIEALYINFLEIN